MSTHLPDMAAGWRRVEPALTGYGARLRQECREVLPHWGDPVEAAEFYDDHSDQCFVMARFANGMRVSICYRHNGWQVAWFDLIGPV